MHTPWTQYGAAAQSNVLICMRLQSTLVWVLPWLLGADCQERLNMACCLLFQLSGLRFGRARYVLD